MKKQLFILAGAFTFMCLPHVRGQSIGPSILNTTGGYGTIAGNDYEWSVGELAMVSTFTASTVTVTQGVLQPAFDALDIKNQVTIIQGLQVFPNPASTIVNIQYESTATGTLIYRLTDIAGKIILKGDADVKQGINTQQLNIGNLAEATYMLEVICTTETAPEQTITYKILKIN